MQNKPWYKSKTIIGLIVLILSELGKRYGIDVSAEDHEAIGLAISDLGKGVGALLVLVGRINSKTKLVK